MTFSRWLSKPWLHFLLIGVFLFWLQGRFFPQPKPVVGPLGQARIEALQQQWFVSVGRLPNEAQQLRLVEAELDRDMLFQRAVDLQLHRSDTVVYQRLLRNMQFLQLSQGKSEQALYEQALEMRLHLSDEVIKRRMIQVMEQLLLAGNPPVPVSEADILAEFSTRRQELRRAPRYSIEHLYFGRAGQGDMNKALQAIQEGGLSAKQALQFSAPFLSGYKFVSQTAEQLARTFGAMFVKNFEQAQPVAGRWVGPIQSTYGPHYVWVNAVEASRDATLAEVRVRLQRDLESRNRASALAQSITDLRSRYEVLQ